MAERETFLAIRRADREDIYGEFGWMVGGTEFAPWALFSPEDPDDEGGVTYELVRLTVDPLRLRTYTDDETWTETAPPAPPRDPRDVWPLLVELVHAWAAMKRPPSHPHSAIEFTTMDRLMDDLHVACVAREADERARAGTTMDLLLDASDRTEGGA